MDEDTIQALRAAISADRSAGRLDAAALGELLLAMGTVPGFAQAVSDEVYSRVVVMTESA